MLLKNMGKGTLDHDLFPYSHVEKCCSHFRDMRQTQSDEEQVVKRKNDAEAAEKWRIIRKRR